MRHQPLLLGVAAPLLFMARADGQAAADTMTVTAYRTPQTLERAGSAISIVGREQIEERQAAVAADALRTLPGLSIARSGPIGAQTQVRMRGAEANHLMVLIDGIKANDVATDDAFSFEHLTTADIERIEVVRGPQSALWGSDALAGIVNVVTHRPTEPVETSAYLEGGSFGLTNGGARLGLRGDNVALNGSVAHLRTDGTNAARSGAEDDGYENTTFGLAASVQALPGLAFAASLRQTAATVEFDRLDFVDGVLVPVDATDQTDIRHRYGRIGAELQLAEGRWIQQLHYGVTRTDTDTSAEAFSGGRDFSSTEGERYGAYYQSSVRVRSGTATRPGDMLTVALSHEREVFSQRAAPSFFGDPNQDQSLHNTGYAVEYLAFLGPDLSLSGSARHDDNSDFGDINTWRATASWTIRHAALRLHGSIGTGQKSPTFFERFGYTPDTFVGNPNLQPEESTGWDLGIERRWLDGRLTADLTYFHADLRNEINGFYCPPPTFACTAINEAGDSRRRGVEFALDGELSTAWKLSASYTYTDAVENDVEPGATASRQREVRRPLHAASVNATSRWLDGRLLVHGSVSYVGQRRDDAFLAAPPFVERVELGDYTLVAIALSYQASAALTLYGRIENALDEDYEDVYGFNTPGAGAFAGVRVKFPRREPW